MAWTNSKVFSSFVANALANAIAFDLSGTPDTFKAALYGNSITPDNTVAEASSRYNAGQWVTGGEVTSTGEWDAGGVALTSPALSGETSTTIMWDAADTASSAGAAISGAYGCLVYDDTLTNDPGICYIYFGGSNGVSNGVFTIVWSGSGLFTASTA